MSYILEGQCDNFYYSKDYHSLLKREKRWDDYFTLAKIRVVVENNFSDMSMKECREMADKVGED